MAMQSDCNGSLTFQNEPKRTMVSGSKEGKFKFNEILAGKEM